MRGKTLISHGTGGNPPWYGYSTPGIISTMLRYASLALAILAAGAAIWFTSLYLGGYAPALAHERAALVPLIAGLGAGILEGFRRGRLRGVATAAAIALLAAWVVFLRWPF